MRFPGAKIPSAFGCISSAFMKAILWIFQDPLPPPAPTPLSSPRMRPWQVSSMVMELKPPAPKRDEGAARAANMSVAWKRHGSKLNAVAQRLRAIRQQDPTAKALVFVQWADLEVKV